MLPTVGTISFTKFPQAHKNVEALSRIEPGVTTSAEVEAMFEQFASPGPLWNDIVRYEPPVVMAREHPSSRNVVLDNELLRLSRNGDYEIARILLWCAHAIVDRRFDWIVQNLLTNADGTFCAENIGSVPLRDAIADAIASGAGPETLDAAESSKAISNILRFMDMAGLIVPTERGKTIIGVSQFRPTRDAVPHLIVYLVEMLQQFGFAPTDPLEFALGVGANHWLGLTAEEFRDAATPRSEPAARSERGDLPAELTTLHHLLTSKRQVILQGAPGVGKTFVARRYVTWAASDRADESRLQGIIDALPQNERSPEDIAAEVVRRGLTALWDIVQFHPAYEYTDFVRALVAEPVANGVTFTPRHRIFSLICAVGLELERLGYEIDTVLILDEVNRADIANVFGELLYALEYRGEAVSTPYAVDGSSSITVPPSLLLIGTMNTADRSIAVIDYALRRRFVFLDLQATPEPIEQHPSHTAKSRELALALFEKVTAALAESPSGLQVGPSYFLPLSDHDDDEVQCQSIVDRFEFEVLPLLEEYERETEIQPSALVQLKTETGFDSAEVGATVKSVTAALGLE